MFGMKGHGSKKHQKHELHSTTILDTKISNLELENEKLRKEIDALTYIVKKES